MSTYYCQGCAMRQHLITRSIPQDVFVTPYQAQKFRKHTQPNTMSPLHGVFTDPSTIQYRDLVASAVASGWVEIDPYRRVSMVLTVDPPPGLIYARGQFQASANAAQLVLPHDRNHLHAFPVFVPGLEQQTCAGCEAHLEVTVCGQRAEGKWITLTSSGGEGRAQYAPSPGPAGPP